MSSVVYPATALTGGTSDCLDGYNGSDMNDGDIGFVAVPSGKVYFYWFDADSALSESSPDVIKPDTGPGAWILLTVQDFDFGTEMSSGYGVYNVTDYGAVGDGVTDDHDAIILTITTANAAGGGIVWFPPLTFACAGGIYPGEELNNITLRGAPGHQLYFDYTAASWENNFYLYGNNITLDSLYLNTSATTRNEGNMGSCVVFPQGDRITVKNCYITNSAGAGIYIQASDVSPYTVTNFDFSHNVIYHTYADGILISDGASHGVISNNLIHTTGDDGISISWAAVNTDEGVYNYPQHIVVEGNKVYYAGTTEANSVGKGLNCNHATDILYSNNDIIASRGAGFGCYAWMYETESTNWTRSGDTITLTSGVFNLANRYVGGYLFAYENGEAYPITANTTTTLTATGCSALTSGGAGFLVSCVRARDVRVIGNKFYYCGCISSAAEAALYDYFSTAYFVNAEYCTFKGNVVYAPYYDGVLKLNGINVGCVHSAGGGGGTTRNIEVSDNEFQNLSGRGLMAVSNNYLQHVIIKNNTFKTVAEEAVYVYRASSTYYMKGDVILDGNTLYYCAHTGGTYCVVVDGVGATSWIYAYRNGRVRTTKDYFFDNYTLIDIESGGGSLLGPLSSTDNAIARWDGIAGSTLQNCGITIDDSNIMTWPSATTGCTLNATPTPAGGTSYFQIACNAASGQYNQLKVKGSVAGSYGSVSAYFGDGSTSEGIVIAHDGSNGLLLTDSTDGTILVKPQGTLAMTIAPTSVTVPSLLYTTSATGASNLICTNTPGSGNSLLQVQLNAPSGYYNQMVVYGTQSGSYGAVSAYYGTKSTPEGISMYHNGTNGVIATDSTDGTILIKPQGTTAMTLTTTSVTVPSLFYTTSASAASNLICTNTPGASNSSLQVILNAASGKYNQLVVYGTESGSYGSVAAYYGTKTTAEGIAMYHNGTNAVIASDTTDGTILIKSQGTTSLTLAPGTIQCANGGAINEFSTDGTMAGNSDSAVPTEKAVVTYVAAAAGSGDVTGPGSSTDNAFARFHLATGKVIQNSTGATLDDSGNPTFASILNLVSGTPASNIICTNTPGAGNALLQVTLNAASGKYNQLVVYGSQAGSYGSLAAYYGTKSTTEGIVMYHNGTNGVIDTDATDGTLLIKSQGTTSLTLAPGTVKCANGVAINEFSSDGTMAGNSDSAVPTEKAVKTYVAATAGTGDVTGPGSSTDNAFARFHSTTGKVIQNSTGATLDDSGNPTFASILNLVSGTAASNINCTNTPGAGTASLQVILNAASGKYNQLVVYGSQAGSYGSLAAYYGTKSTAEGIVMYHNGTNGVIDTDTTDGTLLIKSQGTTSMTVAPGTVKLASGTSINEFSIDGTMGGNSDNAVPTEKAVKTYAVTGPASSTDNAIARWNSTGGRTVQNCYATVDDNGNPSFGRSGASGTIYLNSSGNAAFYLQENSTYKAFFSTSGGYAYLGYNTDLAFHSGVSGGSGTQRAKLDNAGNFYIGNYLYIDGSTTCYLYMSGSDLYWWNGSTGTKLN